MKKLILLLSVLGIFSCQRNVRLEQALKLAGNNRLELEKVLVYYQDSGLKYEAACFLIENMPGYYTLVGNELDSMKSYLKTSNEQGIVDARVKTKCEQFDKRRLKKIFDVKTITSEFLINNIERAFRVWKTRPWNKNLSFDNFCEMILPYRIGDEPLEEWWVAYEDRYGDIMDRYTGDDVIEAANLFCDTLQKDGFRPCRHYSTPHLGALYQLENRVGRCVDECDLIVYLMRTMGIPITLHRYYYSSETRTGHVWPVIRDTTGRYVPYHFLQGHSVRDSVYTDRRRIGKIFQELWERNDIDEKVDGSVPPFFKQSYIKDVSYMYFKDTLEIEMKESYGENVYLGVFGAKEWKGIDRAVVKNGKLYFYNVESEMVYVLLTYEKGKYIELDFPFYYDGERIYPYVPNINQQVSAVLHRKNLLPYWFSEYKQHVKGGRFEMANDSLFSNATLLHLIEEAPMIDYNMIAMGCDMEARYVRYVAPEGQKAELSEFKMFWKEEMIEPYSVYGSIPRDKNMTIQWVNDCDPLTYYVSKDMGAYIVLDFGKRIKFDNLLYITRTDDNYIRIGDFYELFYHAGNLGWVSLGVKQARKPELYYDNVPQNALLYFHNITRGREEQVFHLEDGKQVFVTKMDVE